MVSVHAAPRELAFESGIAVCERAACASTESFALKTIHKRFEDGKFGRRDDEGVFGGFAVGDLVALAIIPQAVEVTEEIERPIFRRGDGAQHAATRFAPRRRRGWARDFRPLR